MWYNKEHPVNNLPDAFKKTPDSNNYKILEIERVEGQIIRTDLQAIDEILDITKASGKTLDLYGERIGQKRGLATDEQYKVLLLAKVMRNLSNGTYESIVNCLCMTFSCDPKDVQFKDEEDTCTVSIVKLPIDKIEKAGFSQKQALAIIRALIPVCITLKDYFVESTFEFAADETTFDENKGFTDVEGGLVGGYFGYYFGSDKEPEFPI